MDVDNFQTIIFPWIVCNNSTSYLAVSISASLYNVDIVVVVEKRNPRKARACHDKSIAVRSILQPVRATPGTTIIGNISSPQSGEGIISLLTIYTKRSLFLDFCYGTTFTLKRENVEFSFILYDNTAEHTAAQASLLPLKP